MIITGENGENIIALIFSNCKVDQNRYFIDAKRKSIYGKETITSVIICKDNQTITFPYGTPVYLDEQGNTFFRIYYGVKELIMIDVTEKMKKVDDVYFIPSNDHKRPIIFGQDPIFGTKKSVYFVYPDGKMKEFSAETPIIFNDKGDVLTPIPNVNNCSFCISHYNENLSWIQNLRNHGFQKIFIGSKTLAPIYISKNVGQEASIYLKYIVDNYNSLDEFTVFLHGHEHAWHQSKDIVSLILDAMQEMNAQQVFLKSLNNYYCGSILGNEWINEIKEWYNQYLKKELGPIDRHGDWTVGMPGCAQFIVHKSLIRLRSLEFYKNLLDWILETPIISFKTSRFMEWSWELFWEERGNFY